MPQPPTSAQLVFAAIGLGFLALIVAAWVGAIAWKLSGRNLLPPPSTKAVPWGWRTVVGLVLTLIALYVLVPPIYLALAGISLPPPGPDRKVDPALAIRLTMVCNAVFLVLAALFFGVTGHARASDFGLEPRRILPDVLRGLIAWPLLAPIVFGVNILAARIWPVDKHPIELWIRSNPSPATMVFTVVSAVIIGPIFEEFLFRGLLLGWLGRVAMKGRVKPPAPGAGSELVGELDDERPEASVDPGAEFVSEWRGDEGDPAITVLEEPPEPPRDLGFRLFVANVAVSLLFAGMHVAVWPSPIPLFVLSLGLGVLYQRTGSLIAPITLHATFNGITMLLMFLSIYLGVPEPPKPFKNPGPAAEKPLGVLPEQHRRPFRIET
jgi:membrane protease YdiL (CAAX protease family)